MSLQSVMTRIVFSLPSGIVQAMAGKKTEKDGKTLDPRIALMAKQAANAAAKTPPGFVLTPAVAREGMKAGFALIDGKRRASVATRDLTVPGGAGTPLEARLYTPAGATGNEPLLVYLHQGGCVLGGLWTCDTWCSILADDVKAIVLNVNYRHAPEDRFPASVDDAVAAYEWAVANAKSLGADGKRVGIGGDSAGGYLSAVVALAMKKAGKPQPALQLLIYPCTDWTSTGGTMVTMADAYPLNAQMMQWFASQYLNTEEEKTDWRVSPALDDLSGLAPALVYTAGFDPLTTQGADYAVRLQRAGVKVKYRCYESLSHSFTAMSGTVPAARKALAEIASEVKQAFGA